ncbi:transcription factor Adf-1-like [Ischnura elegans]|uniref:transcription factor Adf-1-like n=1 Tax=Ischnura elegans TaxID=197161 RepID=UPI001ED87D27|nr:transcription factor Adf-1-like [Ischnura elegans]
MNRLIEEVRIRPCLYDTSCDDYKDAIKRDNSWAEVAQILESDSITVKKNWKKLRDCFRQAVSRRVTESEQKNWKPWRYEKQMAFLLPSMTSRTNRVNYAQHDCEGTSQDDLPQTEAPGGQAFVIEDVMTVPKVKKRKSTSSDVDCVVEYLDDSRNNTSKLDDLDLFFASACQSTRKLPRRFQNLVKREILDSIARAEDQNEEADYKY